MTIGDKIRYQRKRLKLTQTELGEKLGVKTNAVSKWECGRVEDIPTSKIKAMSVLFGVPTSYLIDEEISYNENRDSPLPSNVVPLPKMKKVPLVGQIACGTPILAEQNIEDYIDLPAHINADYALTCRGESMINIGIEDGDIVYIKQQEEVENGEVAAVMVGDDEATLKRFYYEDGIVQLVAENSAIAPKVFVGEAINQVHVIGKALAYTHIIQ